LTGSHSSDTVEVLKGGTLHSFKIRPFEDATLKATKATATVQPATTAKPATTATIAAKPDAKATTIAANAKATTTATKAKATTSTAAQAKAKATTTAVPATGKGTPAPKAASGRPLTDITGEKSRTMLTVFIKGASGQNLVRSSSGAPTFSQTTGDIARWNLLDSGDGEGGIYIQSASRKKNSFLYLREKGQGCTTSMSPDLWKLEYAKNGQIKFRNIVSKNYLMDKAGSLGRSRNGICGSGNCKFKVSLISVAWDRQPSAPASPTIAKVFLVGVSGKNLKATKEGKVFMRSGFSPRETWSILDSGDANSRSLLRAPQTDQGDYLRDNNGKVEMSVFNPNPNAKDSNKEWWLSSEQGGKISFESNSGKFLVDEKGVPGISTAESPEVGNAKRFTVLLKEVKFRL